MKSDLDNRQVKAILLMGVCGVAVGLALWWHNGYAAAGWSFALILAGKWGDWR